MCNNSGRLFSSAGTKTFSQKANDALVNGQNFYLYNESYPFDPASPTGILFAGESDLQVFLTSLTQSQNYKGCYLDGNGITHTYSSTIPNAITVNGESVLINGQASFMGNTSYPIDPAYPTGNTINPETNRLNPQQTSSVIR